ncbi:tetratricopeptide repeat-containing diguanylate cyclase [Undibacterium sp. TC4M20W]|uniref:tetratricopeptide repeat-containing diguanylate cyclase n=1 Tax=Undibacterium sp. TC4M20W TaxID=3413052 RepID=UPI003BF329DB
MSQLQLPRWQTRLMPGLLAITLLCMGGAAQAQAKAQARPDFSEIEVIHTLSDRDNTAALKQLQEYKDRLGKDADYVLRAEVLKTLIGILYDAGKIKEADAANAELLQLARAQKDNDMINMALIGEAFQMLDQGKFAMALVKLNDIQQSLRDSKNAEVLMRLNIAFGMVQLAIGNFDKSLPYFLEALKLADQVPRRSAQAKLYRMESIARLYLNMHNAEKALETTNEALAMLPGIDSPKITSSLQMTRGLALIDLGRHDEALEAYKTVLQIATDAGMPAVAATALGNIADYYLHVRKFAEAERAARFSLEKAQVVNDPFAMAIAKANIGFALAGQKKFAQGIGYINEAKKFFMETGSKSDVENLLSEIGNMYEAADMYKEALATVREQQKLSDELFRSDRARAVATLQEQFNAQQRQKQIELLARENQLKDADIKNRQLQQVVLMLAAVIMVMVGVVVFFLYRRVRKTNEKLREVNEQLEFHAVRDPLTGLYNRRSFVDMMKGRAILPEGERREDALDNPDCLILMDIDHFKNINDSFGHATGDSVLIEVARRLRSTVRDSDMVLRWGGEEFLIYSPRSNPAQLKGLVERILRSIGEENIQADGASVPVTLTAGFISLPFSGLPEAICNWEKALQIADMALYLGKVNGRNRAYGVSRLLIAYEEALPVLDHDLSAAIKAGMVELIEVHGPVKLPEGNLAASATVSDEELASAIK